MILVENHFRFVIYQLNVIDSHHSHYPAELSSKANFLTMLPFAIERMNMQSKQGMGLNGCEKKNECLSSQ